MAGTSYYMFWFRFIPEMFSALSAAFLYGRAFICFSACLAVHYFAVYSVLGSLVKQTCRCFLNCFLLLLQRASACTFENLLVRLPSLCLGVCLFCTNHENNIEDHERNLRKQNENQHDRNSPTSRSHDRLKIKL